MHVRLQGRSIPLTYPRGLLSWSLPSPKPQGNKPQCLCTEAPSTFKLPRGDSKLRHLSQEPLEKSNTLKDQGPLKMLPISQADAGSGSSAHFPLIPMPLLLLSCTNLSALCCAGTSSAIPPKREKRRQSVCKAKGENKAAGETKIIKISTRVSQPVTPVRKSGTTVVCHLTHVTCHSGECPA